MRHVLVTPVVCLLAALWAQPAFAQLYESVGIRAQGLGGAFVSVADDGTATWWNPAGLATGPFFDALVEYDRIRTTPQQAVKAIVVAFPALGLSYYHLPFNQMRALTTSTATPLSGREDDRALSVYGLTVGQSLGDHFVMASTLKVEHADETHADLDLGAMAKYGAFQAGVSVKNVWRPEFATTAGVLQLDRQARAGAALVGHTGGVISDITVAFDADLTSTSTVAGGELRHVAGGLEIWTLGRKLGVRGGVSGNTVGTKGSAASGGLSVAFYAGAYVKTYLDAQYTNGSDESRRSWGLSLRASF